MTKKGTKRKRAPPRRGRASTGVKYRSKRCKVCSACPHGKWRHLQGVRWVSNEHGRTLLLQGCGGASICEHGRQRSPVQGDAVGLKSASTVVGALSCKGAVGLNLRARSSALSLQGVRWSGICEHGRQRSRCKECGGAHSASTVVCALMQGVWWCIRLALLPSAVVKRSQVQGVRWGINLRAVVGALSARSAVGHQSASTVVSALSARTVEAHETLVFNRSQLRRRPGPRPVARALTSVAP